MKNVWFITGASRGLGYAIAEAALVAGNKVVATARNTGNLTDLKNEYKDNLLELKLDVTDNKQIEKAVADAVSHFGKIDVLVNNAGFGIVGAAEAFTEEQVRSQLETNLYAPIAISRAVLPFMRKQGSGRILQVSSLGGRVGTGGITIYQSAKFGLTGFAEALADEVKDLGIWVTSVEPGGFRTDWAGDSMTYADVIEGYDKVEQRRQFFQSGVYVPVGDPVKAAKALVDLSVHPEPPVHLILGSEAFAILSNADERRAAELEKWKPVSLSTDHNDAVNFFDTDQGKSYLRK